MSIKVKVKCATKDCQGEREPFEYTFFYTKQPVTPATTTTPPNFFKYILVLAAVVAVIVSVIVSVIVTFDFLWTIVTFLVTFFIIAILMVLLTMLFKKSLDFLYSEEKIVPVHLQCPHCKQHLFAFFDMGTDLIETQLASDEDVKRHNTLIGHWDTQRTQFAEKINTKASTFSSIFTGVFGIYTLVLFFFGLSTAATNGALVAKNGSSPWLFFIPMVFWLLGTATLLLVTVPIIGNVVNESTGSYLQALDKGNTIKAFLYIIGMIFYAIGLILIIIVMILNFASATPEVIGEQNVQFILSDEGALVLNGTLQFDNTNKTVPMLLLNETTAYEIKLPNNDTFFLKKEWVKEMIIIENSTTTSVNPGMIPMNLSLIGAKKTISIINSGSSGL